MEKIVIGLTGPSSGGKGTVGKYLESTGFKYFSLSDMLRLEATRLGLSHDRDVLQNLGDSLRAEYGPGILAFKITQMKEFQEAKLVVVDAIRHPDEINHLKETQGAKIIGITASPEKLFELMKGRKRPGDPSTFEGFLKMLSRENGEEGGSAMQVSKCLEMADVIVMNEKKEEDLLVAAELALIELGVGIKRVKGERG